VKQILTLQQQHSAYQPQQILQEETQDVYNMFHTLYHTCQTGEDSFYYYKCALNQFQGKNNMQ
jgi:hypothetical protein